MAAMPGLGKPAESTPAAGPAYGVDEVLGDIQVKVQEVRPSRTAAGSVCSVWGPAVGLSP